MAINDYFVVVFKILSYFYEKMKNGDTPNESELTPKSLRINYPYYYNIYRNLFEDGFLTGSSIETDLSESTYFEDFSSIRITTKGIEYLNDNSKMKKAYKFIKEIRDVIPGI